MPFRLPHELKVTKLEIGTLLGLLAEPSFHPLSIILHEICSAEGEIRGAYEYAETAVPLAKRTALACSKPAIKLL